MEVPQFDSLPPECPQACRSFLGALNEELRRSADELADFDGPDSEVRKAAILHARAQQPLQGSEAKDALTAIVKDTIPSFIALDGTENLTEPVTAMNAMDCSDGGCRIARAIFLLNVAEE